MFIITSSSVYQRINPPANSMCACMSVFLFLHIQTGQRANAASPPAELMSSRSWFLMVTRFNILLIGLCRICQERSDHFPRDGYVAQPNILSTSGFKGVPILRLPE
ncbi:hypothetical protein NPIL_41781 [Nephila pilipes]|uniref:Uncharacterized protein n=1 Tax=Nephila pilipes TaxID=299642 RepID=A0A8X6THH6_NEPPI|nr:hypothetical protein NPIL_41781 [Nephila pilipes]